MCLKVVLHPSDEARQTHELCVDFRDWENKKMRRNITLALLGVVLLFGGATRSVAEVKRVEMHIGGYLCGN